LRRAGIGSWSIPALALSLAPLAGAMQQRDVPPVFDPEEAPVQGVREPPRMMAGKSVDRIVQDIEKKYRARVIKQEFVDEDGRRVLKLRLYNDKDGKVWFVRVDPATGKEL
jgi:hypothetical protein